MKAFVLFFTLFTFICVLEFSTDLKQRSFTDLFLLYFIHYWTTVTYQLTGLMKHIVRYFTAYLLYGALHLLTTILSKCEIYAHVLKSPVSTACMLLSAHSLTMQRVWSLESGVNYTECLLYWERWMGEWESDFGCYQSLGVLNLHATHDTHGCKRLPLSQQEKERNVLMYHIWNEPKPTKPDPKPHSLSGLWRVWVQQQKSIIYSCAGIMYHSDRRLCGHGASELIQMLPRMVHSWAIT